MITVTLSPDLEQAIVEEAELTGTTPELLTLDVLQERFVKPPSSTHEPEGSTLAHALSDYIGAISTHEHYPEGSTLSEQTGRKFAQLMAKGRNKGKV